MTQVQQQHFYINTFREQCFTVCCTALLYLHVFVFDLLAGGDAVGDVQVDELWRQVHSCGQPEDAFKEAMSNFSLRCPLVVVACMFQPVQQ